MLFRWAIAAEEASAGKYLDAPPAPERAGEKFTNLSGWLWKLKREANRNGITPDWSKRFFTIEGPCLKWYRSKEDTQCCDSVDLSQITRVCSFGSQGSTFSFIISYPSRNLFLRASALGEMKMWIRAIQMQADMSVGGNGYRLPSSPSSSAAALTGASPSKAKTMKSIVACSKTLDEEIDRVLAALDAEERKVLQAPKRVPAPKSAKMRQPSVRREDEVMPFAAHHEELLRK